MRALARIIRQFRSNSRRKGENYGIGLVGTRHLVTRELSYTLQAIINARNDRFSPPSLMTSRALCTHVDQVSNEENGEKGGPLVEYERRIAAGELMDGDLCQLGTLRELQRLYDELVEKSIECRLDRYAASEKAGRSRWLWSRFLPQSSYSPVKGLYLYGGVGTGKTMLMDLFYDQLPCTWRKKRIHFHDFMLNVHRSLQRHMGVSDPLEVVAGEISDESILLCLDEFMVTDVADALILNRLFNQLFNDGVVLVATSNRAPDNLYEGGLQRDLFLPFIATVKERCVVREIGSSVDYRKMMVNKDSILLDWTYQAFLRLHFRSLSGNIKLVHRRSKWLWEENYRSQWVQMDVHISISKNFVIGHLEQQTILGYSVMYENKARLLCTAEGSPFELFERIVTVSDAKQIAPRTSSRSRKNDDLDLCVDNELGFAKDRTISRLTEINSKEYQEQHAAILAAKQLEQRI